MTDEPTPDDIDDALEQFENEPWCVDDWHHESGRFETPTLEIELEWSPIESVDTEALRGVNDVIMKVIDEQSTDAFEGAPVDTVVETAVESVDNDEITEAAVAEIIDQMKQRGEVYEPRTDHLRRT